MALIINPGSRIGEPSAGWTNTEATARGEAERWLPRIHADGMTDVELLDGSTEHEGRWVFSFRHKVTGTVVKLETHGIDGMAAYEKEHIFSPRIYWNESSTSNPELEHFAAPGFVALRTFAAEDAPGRWTALRAEITRDAAIEQELGDGYSDMDTDPSWDSANKHWGRAGALREVLAAMAGMEGAR